MGGVVRFLADVQAAGKHPAQRSGLVPRAACRSIAIRGAHNGGFRMTTPQTQRNGGAPPWVNRIVRFLLRSPLHPVLSGNTLLLTITGRMSGKQYTIPVSYIQDGDMLSRGYR